VASEHHLEDGPPNSKESHLGFSCERAAKNGLLIRAAVTHEFLAFSQGFKDAAAKEGFATPYFSCDSSQVRNGNFPVDEGFWVKIVY